MIDKSISDKYYAGRTNFDVKDMAEKMEIHEGDAASASDSSENQVEKKMHHGLREAKNFSIETHILGKYCYDTRLFFYYSM